MTVQRQMSSSRAQNLEGIREIGPNNLLPRRPNLDWRPWKVEQRLMPDAVRFPTRIPYPDHRSQLPVHLYSLVRS